MNFTPPDFYPLYVIPVGLALLVGLLFPVTRHIHDRRLCRQYFLLQLITFVSAIFGAKLVLLVAEFHWPWAPLPAWRQILDSGRSIVGALIFGLLGAELAKPLLRYPLPPNDRFAALIPFTIATGRMGCLLSGCCRGVPYDGPCSIAYSDGIARHPAPLYEIIFQLSAGIGAIVLVKQKRLVGCVFSLYLIGYGAFRFLTEFIRETPKTFGAFSAYQWLSIAMVALGTFFLLKRRFFPPPIWQTLHSSQALAAAGE